MEINEKAASLKISFNKAKKTARLIFTDIKQYKELDNILRATNSPLCIEAVVVNNDLIVSLYKSPPKGDCLISYSNVKYSSFGLLGFNKLSQTEIVVLISCKETIYHSRYIAKAVIPISR